MMAYRMLERFTKRFSLLFLIPIANEQITILT